MAKKIKWNYAVVRNVFGDYWIGKTKLKPLKDIIFVDIKEAIEKAQDLFKRDFDFDPDLCEDDDNYDDENYCQYNELEETIEETAEEINKNLEKFIVGVY